MRKRKHYHEDLSTGEAAEACKVNPQTIINWCELGRLSCTRIDGGPRRIPRSEVTELLRRNSMEVPAWLVAPQNQAA